MAANAPKTSKEKSSQWSDAGETISAGRIETLYGLDFLEYNGFWYRKSSFEGMVDMKSHFEARPDDIIVASSLKTGTTWMKALIYSIITQSKGSDQYPHEDLLGLKSHAVTLYEAGKLGDASVGELCKDLLTLEGTKFEGELQEFANHAFSLRCALECLRSGGLTTDTTTEDTTDLIDLHSSVGDLGTTENPRKSTLTTLFQNGIRTILN